MIDPSVMEKKLCELVSDLRGRAEIEWEGARDEILGGEPEGCLMAAEAYEASADAVDEFLCEAISCQWRLK